MNARAPQTPLEAVGRRRFLVTGWPWRSLGYLLTSLLVMLVAALPLAALAAPWTVLLVWAGEGRYPQPLGTLLLLILLGAVLVAAFGPLVALPLAALERRRLRLVDARPVESPHRRLGAVGLWSWLRTRYTEAPAWRELGYAWLLVTAVPALYLVVLLVVLSVPLLAVSPLLVRGGEQIAIGFDTLTTVQQALPYAVAGVALLPAVPYVLALAAGAHAAVARALLHGGDQEELHARLVEVSRSRARLVDAFEAERRRIERDLHDGAQRRLVALTLQLAMARLDVPPDSPAGRTLAGVHEQAKQLMAELRELIRGIHPRVLADRGLAAALRELADDAAVPVTVRTDLPERLPALVEHTAYFVAAEALTNIAKHAGATSVTVSARHQDGHLTVEVADDGRGGADPARGTGLTGLADRAAVADGRMLLSSPPGGPTVLRVEIPCSQNTA